MNSSFLFHAQGFVSLATICLALPAGNLIAADPILITQASDIDVGTSSTYWDSTHTLWSINGGLYYANSGNLDFGTTDSGDNLSIGYSSTGNHLTLLSGGTMSNYQGYIGYATGSNGAVTVKDTGSTWTNYNNLNIGYNGTGTLSIENGGAVSNLQTYIGYKAGSNGTVTVKDTGSTWTNSSNLYVGKIGTGSLSIENGGSVVSSTAVCMGNDTSGNGTATVTGKGSKWTISANLYVGFFGTGTLKIENGGFVSNTVGNIAYSGKYACSVTVKDAGSEWINSNALSLGAKGTLTIESGALVTATAVDLASGSAIYLGGGYLALSSTDETTDFNALTELLTGGKSVFAWDSATHNYVQVTSLNYDTYTQLAYYADITTYDALDSYNLTGAYTVLTSRYSVPEPSTYAFFGGLGALALVLFRRKTK